MDEPKASARPDENGSVGRPASEYEAEWREGLSRLMSNLEGEFDRALQTARRQASDAVKGIEHQGLDLLTSLEARRQVADSEHAAMEGRVAAMQADIVAAEEELRQNRAEAEREATRIVEDAQHRAEAIVAEAESRAATIGAELDERRTMFEADRQAAEDEAARVRAASAEAEAEIAERRKVMAAEEAALQQRVLSVEANIEAAEEELEQARDEAEREAAETVAAARRRAESIIARAESQAEEIVAEARASVASRRRGGRASAADAGDDLGAEGRLGRLSARIGLLRGAAAGTAAAGVAATGAGAAAIAAMSPTAPTEEEASISEPSEGPSGAGEPAAADLRAVEREDEPSIGEAPAAAASDEPAPPPELNRQWSQVSDADEDEESVSDADTVTVPAWPTAHTPAMAQPDDEPVSIRRTPEPIAEDDEETAEEPEPPAQVGAVPPMPSQASSVPTSAVPPIASPPAASSAPGVAAAPEPVAAGTTGAVTQTLIFQSVPNFQAALALERSLKAMSEVREVRVADFDERQLTFQVTHELGAQLPNVLLTQRAGELEFVEARPERVEFVFRS